MSLPRFDSPKFRALISEWLQNERFVAAVDAFMNGNGDMIEVARRTFNGPPYLPEGVSSADFRTLIAWVAERIWEVKDLEEIRRKYRHFYQRPPL